MNLQLLEKFTSHLRHTLSHSIHLAWKFQYPNIQPLFLLYGMSEQRGSIAASVLEKHQLSSKRITSFLQKKFGSRSRALPRSVPTQSMQKNDLVWPEFAPATTHLIESAAQLAMEFRHAYVGTEHLLLAMIRQPDKELLAMLHTYQIQRDMLHTQLVSIMTSTSKFSEIQSFFSAARAKTAEHSHSAHHEHATTPPPSSTPALDYFGVDLTSGDHSEQIDPVIGREQEISRLMHILARRTKNNPALIGEAGVGKTAIVEGLAKKIVEGDVPDVLLQKRIIGLDLSLVVAGSMYRGEFESRVKQIIEETSEHPEIILFIDEIHTLVGSGGANGANLDAANMLKPALAKGDIRCIGATTAEEYRKYIEHDPALERRFQAIRVHEPSEQQSVGILKGIRRYYETFHHVDISDEVIDSAVRWSVRYLPERRLPDKAIDLIDEAGAKLYVNRSVPEPLKQYEAYHRRLKEIQYHKDAAAHMEQFNSVLELKQEEDTLLAKAERAAQEIERLRLPRTPLAVTDIANALTQMTGIPVEHILSKGPERFQQMESVVRQFVKGQNDAITKVVGVLKRSYAGLSSPSRPLGSFLFLGPSGVGKTHLAQVLAQHVFGDEQALIRMDMSEFSESFGVSKLLGSPAGYVGYNEGVKLSDQIRKRPYSVVLFDEIEKAHPDMYNVLLQLLDEGRLTDSTNRELNFRNAIILMTSNVGIELLTKQAEMGFDDVSSREKEMSFAEIESTIRAELQDAFPQEFLNRIDQEIVFRPLDQASMQHIVALEFEGVAERLMRLGVRAVLTDRMQEHLARESYSPKQGARFVRKKIAELVEGALADQLLRGIVAAGDSVMIEWEKAAVVGGMKNSDGRVLIMKLSTKKQRRPPKKRMLVSP